MLGLAEARAGVGAVVALGEQDDELASFVRIVVTLDLNVRLVDTL